MFGEDHK